MGSGVVVGDGVAAVTRGDTLVMLWIAPATTPRWKWQLKRHYELLAECPEGIVCLTLIMSASKPPDSALRTTMQTDHRQLGLKVRKLVVLPVGDSLWLSVVRTIVRTGFLLSGLSKRHVVASTLREGLDHVATVAGPKSPSTTELRAAIDQVCAVFGITLQEAA